MVMSYWMAGKFPGCPDHSWCQVARKAGNCSVGAGGQMVVAGMGKESAVRSPTADHGTRLAYKAALWEGCRS